MVDGSALRIANRVRSGNLCRCGGMAAADTNGMSAAQLRHLFVSLACVLLGVGVLMVYSASITARPSTADEFFLSRHLKFLALAACCGCAGGALPLQFWKRAAPWLFATTVSGSPNAQRNGARADSPIS